MLQTLEKQSFKLDKAFKKKQAVEKNQRDLALVEAALYVSGRPLDLKELCSVLKTRSKNKVRKLAEMLMKEYTSRNTSLEILQVKDERYVLQLKPEFTPHVKKLVKKPLLSTGPLKTLAYVAYRQPVSQRRVAEMRGRHAYSHIKQLKEMDLVVGDRKGRSTFLRTTGYFADYFGLSHELPAMKRQLKKVFQQEMRVEEKQNPPKQGG
ncbi:SMC-Scp complex subunit ScpB [Candidatus Bathyarchaeota archaeon]|nr:SMC-Scp complex subunit ScpB [Candidatus Bathyarchaeota archaeon]MCK4668703.1 SMC-Scp complex subunit ScpB [Candidatus Bathyarchaeota archaeon]TET62581.1 MAG: SMC-Scp complex subunit ScpB [Candidatus Bathyarchaeota archaeon]